MPEGEPEKEKIHVIRTVEQALRDLENLRPGSWQEYKVKEEQYGSRLGVSIALKGQSIISERADGTWEVFPMVNGQMISDLFGLIDDVCPFLTLRQALHMADLAIAASEDESKIPELGKYIHECYPEGYPGGPEVMAFRLIRGVFEGNDGVVDKTAKQWRQYSDEPKKRREREQEEDDEA